MDLGPVDGRLLEHDRLARQPLGERGEDVARRERLARARRSGRRRRAERLRRRAVALRQPPGERAHGGRGGRREHGQLDRAAVHLVGVVADESRRVCRRR